MKWAIFLACAANCTLAPPAFTADQFFEHSYAVVIGIDRYTSPMWPQLQYGVKDAKAIAAFLATQNYDKVIPLYDQQATKQAIVAVMQNQLAPNLKTRDRVLVFFAGHGYTETLGGKDRGYIVPYDGGTQSAGYISMDELETLSDYMGNARHQLFIMDSCYGGLLAATRGSMVSPSVPDYLTNITNRVARQVITAGGKNQEVLDGGPKGHSYFVDYFLEALADGKADMNGDGYITFSELSSYLIPRASNRQQTPAFGYLSGHQAGEYLFRAPTGRTTPAASSSALVSGLVRAAKTGDSVSATTNKWISVSVTDEQGKSVPNLVRANFQVFEGLLGPATITDFRDGHPAKVVILLGSRYWDQAANAARLVDSLDAADYVSLATYDRNMRILTDFSLDRVKAHAALNQKPVPVSNESNLLAALKDLEARLTFVAGQKAIVAFTSGLDTTSLSSIDATRSAIRAGNAPIFTIRMPLGSQEISLGSVKDSDIARDTIGHAFSARTPTEYPAIFNAIAGTLHSYRICYQGNGGELFDPSVKLASRYIPELPLKQPDVLGVERPYHVSVTKLP